MEKSQCPNWVMNRLTLIHILCGPGRTCCGMDILMFRPILAVNADGTVELLKYIAGLVYLQFVPCGNYLAEVATQFRGGLSNPT